jgi:Fe-S-cluster-containing dehydrogenase component
MTKCHLCHHRLEARERPACVAACPTEALQLSNRAEAGFHIGQAWHEAPPLGVFVPGFSDPAGCRPTTRFRPARGARRAALLRALEERLRT